MKKISIISLIALCAVLFNSCETKKNILGAEIEITVKNWPGDKPEGVTVYMFKDKEVDKDTDKSKAEKQVVTNASGVALFDLNLTELNILESQTSLYFAVFYRIGDKDYVVGTVGVTIKRGETKKLELTIP